MRRAVLSVSDKTGVVDFARGLAQRGFELVSTGGTASALAAAGLHVTPVAQVTGFPEMMDGRVKTLHPKVHGGILARRHQADDLAAAAREGIGLIDVVAVNLYPFARTAADPAASFDHLVEQIDIGGPSLVRAAAKNFRDVFVVVDPADYPAVLAALDAPSPAATLRFDLARRAFAHTAAYDTTIAQGLDTVTYDAVSPTRVPLPLAPARLVVEAARVRDLRYGENPHQAAAWYAVGDGPGLGAAVVVQGKELSYTNLLDLDAAARLVLEFDEPAAAVIKHTNPCGVATGARIAEAFLTARDADALSAFGGIVGLNRTLDGDTARALTTTFIEAVVAPAVDDDARATARRQAEHARAGDGHRGLPSPGHGRADARGAVGARGPAGPGTRHRDRGLGAVAARERARRECPSAERRRMDGAALCLAGLRPRQVEHRDSFAEAGRTRAIGAGQMSRVDAVKVAVMKACGWRPTPGTRPLAGTVAASDAFFPFRDGLDAVAAAGATAVVHPGGSVKDAEVIAAADEQGLAMVFTGRRHFRHLD